MKEEKKLIFDILEKVKGRSDMDWVEIRDAYNLDCHPDTLRKASVGIKMAADAGCLDFDKADVDDYAEIYIAKKQFYDQRREYNKLLTDEARQRHVEEELIRCAEKLNSEKILTQVHYKENVWVMHEREAVLFLADWHFGIHSDNVWNKYSPEIADARIQRLMEDTVRKLHENDVNKLHIVIMGDMISGAIHNSIRVQCNETAVDQLMQVSERLAELISELANSVSWTEVYCTYGNHARTVANLGDSIHADNLERIIPFWLKQRMKNRDDVHINEDNAYELLRICACGHEIAAVHGDLDAGKNNSMLTMSVLYEKNFGRKMEYLVMGHFHKRYSDENLGIEQIGVGSLCGTDEYAKNKRLFSKPSQTLLIFDEDGLDSIHDIILSQ